MRIRNRLLSCVLGVMACLAASPAAAQSDNPADAGLQFDFSLPGARSLALAGAFVGVADDATAAWSNPAGLVALSRPEFSIEGRSWNLTSTAVTRGHAFGPATGIGFDTVNGLTQEGFSSRTGAPSFVSFVYPKSRFAVAGYRQQLQKFKASLRSDGVFIRTTSPTPIFAEGAVDRASPFKSDLQIDVVNYGAAAAVVIGGGVSAGVSVVMSDFSLRSQTDLFTYVPFNNFNAAVPPSAFAGVGQYYGAPDFSAENVYTRTTEQGDDTALAISTGLFWRHRSGRASAGFAFRQGPKFTYDAKSVFGPGIRRAGGFATEGSVADDETVSYAVPNVYSAGVGVRPLEHVLLSVEYDRVQYSRLSENTAEIFGVEESPFPGESQIGALIRRSLFFKDSNQLRFGAEYAFVTSSGTTIAARGGVWNDPDHRMNFDRENLTAQQRASIARTDVRYVPGTDAIHWTSGIGVVFSRFQIDAAVDISDPVKTVSASTVIRF